MAKRILPLIVGIILVIPQHICAQTLEETARHKINILNDLILEAEQRGTDAYKERMTIATAEMFLDYANWDEENYDIIWGCFDEKYWYRNYATELATMLPDKERRDMIRALDEGIEALIYIRDSIHTRKPIPRIDHSMITYDGGQLMHDGKPVFLHDYMLEDKDWNDMDEFYGAYDGEYISPLNVINEQGDLNSGVANRLANNTEKNIGQVWVDNRNIPQWAKDKYGFLPPDDYSEGNRIFTKYDIDNPGAREMFGFLFKEAVTLMKDAPYTKLGYMTMNEPHFNIVEGTWETGGVSEFTKAKFRTWLSEKHESIDTLNAIWGTSFEHFDSVKVTVPISQSHQGSPMWYDLLKFNQYRVAQWFIFMRDEIKKYDSTALVHFKVMPRFFAENERGQGLDFEAIARLSDISGNDAGSHYWNKYRDIRKYDPNRYSFYWQETAMAYDFFRSVEPDQVIYNSEVHYDSWDPDVDPEYIRAIYWLAHVHGLNASLTWTWVRNADGSVNPRWTEYFGGTYSQNPLAAEYMADTYMDLNANSDIISEMQEQRKPLRIFYSETSAINKATHIDDVFALYQAMYYSGISLGYATRDILNEQDPADWDVVAVYKTPYVTQDELDALQAYLDAGGTVIVDGESLTMNEYGESLAGLSAGGGTLINVASLTELKSQALTILDQNNSLPEVTITETNSGTGRACTWKCIEGQNGNKVISIVNLGNTTAELSISLDNASTGTALKDLLTGAAIPSTFNMKSRKVRLIELIDAEDTTTVHAPSVRLDDPAKYLSTEYLNNGTMDLFLYYDAGTGETVTDGSWNGISCKLVEKDATGSVIAEYQGTYSNAVGQTTGVANIRIDLNGATPTDSLAAGHYYALEPVFTSSKDSGTDVYLNDSVTGIKILDPASAVFLEFDDPLGTQSEEYYKIASLDVVLNYSAGAGNTVLQESWNGVACRLIERNESDEQVNEYLASDTSAIGTQSGVANISFDISGVTPTDSLDAGHYYELQGVLRSSKGGGTDIYSAVLTGIKIYDYNPSPVPKIWMDDRDKYLTTEYVNEGKMEVYVYYDAGEGNTVLDSKWNGICGQLVEKNESGTGIAWYKSSDISTIGTNHGLAHISINIDGIPTSAELDPGHYYALVILIHSSYNPDKLYYLSEPLDPISVISEPVPTPPEISLDNRSKYQTTEYLTEDGIDVVVNFDAGQGHTVLDSPWSGVTCKLIEKDGTGADVKEYVANDATATGLNKGTANVSIDITEATATEKLDEGHYYELVPVFRSSYDPGMDVFLSDSLTGIIIVEPVVITPPDLSLDDPSKYKTTEYPNTGSIYVVVNYDAGNPFVVLDGEWKGVSCLLVEKDENDAQVNMYLAYDESAIGQSSGVSDLSIDISGATPTDSLDAGHYYELIPVFRSSYNANFDINLSERVTGIMIVDTSISVSVLDHVAAIGLNIYPNPAGSVLHIGDNQAKHYDIRLFNLQGELLIQRKNINYLNIQSLPDGMYILQSGPSRQFFIKQETK